MRFLFSALLTILFSCSLQAGEKHIVIGVEDFPNLPCCTYDFKEKQFLGYARSLFDAFAKEYHYHITYRPLPVKRLYHQLISDQIDLKFPDNPAWRQDLKDDSPIQYSQAIISYTNGIMTRPDAHINTLKDLKSLCYVRGFGLPIPQQAALHGVRVIKTNLSTEAFAMVLNHRVDGVFFNTLGSDWILNHQFNQPNALVLNLNLPHTPVNYFASTVRSPNLLTELNTFLSKNTSLLAKLRKEYEIPTQQGAEQ